MWKPLFLKSVLMCLGNYIRQKSELLHSMQMLNLWHEAA